MNDNAKRKEKAAPINEAIISQINVLRTLNEQTGTGKGQRRTLAIQEIAEMSGVEDEREIQRNLFILEGQKLVSPFPEGDFTSRNWLITEMGLDAIKKIGKTGLN